MSERTENDARRSLIDAVGTLSGIGKAGITAGELSWRWPRSAAAGLLIATTPPPHHRQVTDDLAWLPLDSHVLTGDVPGEPVPGNSVPGNSAPGRRARDSHGVEAASDATALPLTWRLHRDLLLARPEIASVLLLQGPESVALACSARIQREGVPAFHDRLVLAGGADLRCAPYARPGSPQLSDAALAALADRHACLLANLGLLVVGVDPLAALTLAFEMETLCAQYRRLLMLGDPVLPSRHGAMT